MRHTPSPQRATQFNLFHPRPKTLQWSQLPSEVRQNAVRLLARLLRHYRGGQLSATAGREAGDE
jgi:hypothetical protein